MVAEKLIFFILTNELKEHVLPITKKATLKEKCCEQGFCKCLNSLYPVFSEVN